MIVLIVLLSSRIRTRANSLSFIRYCTYLSQWWCITTLWCSDCYAGVSWWTRGTTRAYGGGGTGRGVWPGTSLIYPIHRVVHCCIYFRTCPRIYISCHTSPPLHMSTNFLTHTLSSRYIPGTSSPFIFRLLVPTVVTITVGVIVCQVLIL